MIAPLAAAAPDTLLNALENLTGLLAPVAGVLDPSRLAAIQTARTEIAAILDSGDSPAPRGPAMAPLLQAADALVAHPAGPWPMDNLPTIPDGAGWHGSLARLFAGPAWQIASTRPLEDHPAWLWPVYARHLFAAPAFFATEAQEDQWSAHIAAHLDALVRMLEANRGSSASRAVAQIALDAATHWPAVGSASRLRQRRQSLGRLHALLAPRLAAFTPHEPPAPGFPLRVALIRDDSGPCHDVLDTNRLATLLDSERIELTVHTPDTLPADTAASVAQLRAGRHDAAIFAGDLTAPNNALVALALHRVAPRQFATALCPHTTGLPGIDCFLAETGRDADAHTENLARMPAALAFEFPADDTGEPAPVRADFGLPDGARLLVATAHPRHSTAAVRDQWQALLDANPDARLILLPGTAGPALDQLLADCAHRFGNHLILAGNEPLPLPALTALLRVCNAYLPGPHDLFARDLALSLGLEVPDAGPRIDCLAFADALTAVLEIACRTPDEPLFAPAIPADLATRHEQGNQLLAFGRADRAVLYLLAAVDDPQAGPDVWHDLALALHANQQPPDAIQALETCVRLAPDRLDSWLLLRDWAADYGHTELVTEITGVVDALAS